MGDFRLEDLWAIVQGLIIVGAVLFLLFAFIALWPQIITIARLLFRVGAWRLTPALASLATDLRERARAKPVHAAILTEQARQALRNVKPSQVVMSPVPSEPPRTEERTGRTNERSPHDLLWGEFRLDRRRERLIAVLVEEDLTVTEIRTLLKGESTTIGEEIEAARQRLGKAPSQPYTTPIAQRPTAAQFEADPELSYQPPPRG